MARPAARPAAAAATAGRLWGATLLAPGGDRSPPTAWIRPLLPPHLDVLTGAPCSTFRRLVFAPSKTFPLQDRQTGHCPHFGTVVPTIDPRRPNARTPQPFGFCSSPARGLRLGKGSVSRGAPPNRGVLPERHPRKRGSNAYLIASYDTLTGLTLVLFVPRVCSGGWLLPARGRQWFLNATEPVLDFENGMERGDGDNARAAPFVVGVQALRIRAPPMPSRSRTADSVEDADNLGPTHYGVCDRWGLRIEMPGGISTNHSRQSS